MILQVGEDTSKIAIRTKSWRNQRFAEDWNNLYLIIEPGQGGDECHCCNDWASPWFAWGCWPGHRTGVDLMNPTHHRHDFPAFVIKAEERTVDDTIVFTLPERWRQTVPFGRYNGTLRYQVMDATVPINAYAYLGEWRRPDPECGCGHAHTPPVLLPHPKPCELVRFDIDYGPLCHQHFIDRIDVELDDAL